MTNSKSTKRALLASVLSMFVCAAMLVGSTFAWFTDSATSGLNRIQAGTLDVRLIDAQGNSLEGQTLSFQNKDGSAEVLWEPGCTFATEPVRIQNNGDLALKYKVVVSGIAGDAKLLEVIDFAAPTGENQTIRFNTPNAQVEEEGQFDFLKGFTYTPGGLGELLGTGSEPITVTEFVLLPEETSPEFVLQGHMQEQAGNQYQGLSIEGIGITVYATQAVAEKDSSTEQYDKDAAYPEVSIAATPAAFADALAALGQAGNKNVLISVTEDLANTKGIVSHDGNELAVDLGGNTVTVGGPVGSSGTVSNGMQLLKGSAVTIKNGTYRPASDKVEILVQNYSDLILENVTLDATTSTACEYVISSNCGDVVVKGSTNITANAGQTALDVMHWENDAYKKDGTSVVFDETMTGTVNGTIDVYCYTSSKQIVKPVTDGGATLTIKGGTFLNSGLSLDEFKAFVPAGFVVTEVPNGYQVTAA